MQGFQEVAFCVPIDFEDTHLPVARIVPDPTSLVSVCRHWRQLCLGFARLWSHIPAIRDTPDRVYSKLVTLYLRRSTLVPLQMSVVLPEVDGSNTTAATALLRSHSHRIQEIYLEHTGNRNRLSASVLLDVISHPAPLLDCLVIALSNRTLFHPWPSMPILFCGEMHNVRALALQTSYAFYPGNSLENLAHLRLSFSFSEPLLRLQPLLRFLHNTPQLETLWIARCGNVHVAEKTNYRPLRLGRLHTISLSADPYVAFPLLSLLNVPSCAKLHLPSPDLPCDSEVDFPLHLDHRLLDRLSRLTAAFDVTSLDIMDIRNSILDAPPSRRSGYYIIADGQRSGLWILLDTFVASQAIAPSLQALHQSLPLRHVAAVRLAFDHRRMALLPPLVSSMPSLTTLVLRCPRTTTEGDERVMLSTVAAALRAAAALCSCPWPLRSPSPYPPADWNPSSA